MSTRSYTQSAKVDLDLRPRDPKSIGFLLLSWWICMWSLKVIGQKLKSLLCRQGLIHRVPKWTLTFDPVTQNQKGSSSHHGKCACYVWKWLGKNDSRYFVHKVLYIECQSWPWPLTPWPKINRVPPLIMVNVHVKFESDWAKTVVAIVGRTHARMHPPTHPLTNPLTHSPNHPRTAALLYPLQRCCKRIIKRDLPTLFQTIRRPETNIFFSLAYLIRVCRYDGFFSF